MKTIREEGSQSKRDQLDQQWEMQFFELQKFKKKYGHCDVPKNGSYHTLARWCGTQRIRRKFHPLKYSPDRLKKLNELGFCWSIKDKWFEKRFRELNQYRKRKGHCNVSNDDNMALAAWCRNLRHDYKVKVSTLTKERIKRLTELGFSWTSPKEQENEMRWEQQFSRLKKYKKKYGHCNVSLSEGGKHKSLMDWVRAQRKHYHTKNECLSADKIKKLNDVGFKWINPLKVGAKRINDTDLLNELRRLHTMRGLPPSSRYVVQHGKYSVVSYNLHFGSMAKARKAAGITQNEFPRKIYSDGQLLDELKRLANLLGRTPKHADVLKHGKYSPKLYEKRFGGLRKARENAGMSSGVIFAKNYSDDEMLDELKRLAVMLGKKPSGRDVVKHGKYSMDSYYSHFGNISKARKAAGIDSLLISS